MRGAPRFSIRFQSSQFTRYRRWAISLTISHFQQVRCYMLASDLLPVLYFLPSKVEADLVQVIAIGHYCIVIGAISPLLSYR